MTFKISPPYEFLISYHQ